MKQQVIINVGVSGSGKSTWTIKFLKEHPEFIRINRDDIRSLLYGTIAGYYSHPDLNKREGIVTGVEDILFYKFLDMGKSIIIDNTNLKKDYLNRWLEATSNSAFINLFPPVVLLELKDRVRKRDNTEFVDYIGKQFEQYKSIEKYINENYKQNLWQEQTLSV